ncbi:hypothetical protein FEM48_Zijuj04G0114100 [Ziziphus jujuba var. spinosa]|uniref:Transcription factor BEE 1-like n=1 Tax=Ziziphus jujuba var. spinosa TaxID=714518 RepID=A0A978VJL1_ZIZJJ|nr:hypothetical protein FEM48_Zijuj04G0114100 [Ziziphus jujuba var. spinosa]
MADPKCYRPSIAYPETAVNMEMIINQFGPEMDSSILLKNFNTSITDYSVANFFGCKNHHVLGHDHHHQNPTNLFDQDLPAASQSNHQLMIMNDFNESKKRKVNMEDVFSIASSKNGLEDKEKSLKKNSLVKGNNYRSRKNNNKKEEVIHVRAKRGQATDSHSLAERVYYKTMGMTMMLDEIISYVHSLQNQIEETYSQDPQEMEKMRAQLLPFNMV